MTEGQLFVEMILCAMIDAVTEGKIAQLQTTITPPGATTAKLVRVIVLPEEMEIVREVGGTFERPA